VKSGSGFPLKRYAIPKLDHRTQKWNALLGPMIESTTLLLLYVVMAHALKKRRAIILGLILNEIRARFQPFLSCLSWSMRFEASALSSLGS
jgi:hypothetical protein